MVAKSAVQKSSAPEESASQWAVLDYRNTMPVEVPGVAEVAEAPDLVAQSAAEEPRLCLRSSGADRAVPLSAQVAVLDCSHEWLAEAEMQGIADDGHVGLRPAGVHFG